jgi:DNA-binding ferritin-like protein
MLELAIKLRALQLFGHHAHHIVARIVFFQDHDILSEIYTKAEADYDDVIERFIGLKGAEALDETKVLIAAVNKVQKMPLKIAKENKELLQSVLKLIEEINTDIEKLCKEPGLTQGTIQMVGNIADKNEVLVYKLKQRLS